MIPLCLVTGFLGSGKTTLLARIHERHRERGLAYLVNEFSPRNIDGEILDLPQDELVTVAGGSIFCHCRVTDFITALQRLAQRDPQPEGVVIEASGMADPRVMRSMLQETGLAKTYRLAGVISTVDPGSFRKLLKTLPNMRAQIEAADTVIINKTDRYGPEQIGDTQAGVLKIQPGVRVLETQFCQAEVDLFPELPVRELSGEYAKCRDPHYVQATARVPGMVDWPRLRQRLSELQASLYRAKGFLPTADGWILAEYSTAGWSQRPWPRDVVAPEFVLIGSGASETALQAVAAQIERNEFAA